MTVVSGKADGVPKRQEKDLPSEAEARSAADRFAQELLTRGYVESRAARQPEQKRADVPVPRARDGEPEYALDVAEEPPAPVLPRGAVAAAAVADEPAARPKKKKKKKRKKGSEEKKDWVFLGGLGLAVPVLCGILGWFLWSTFLKPASIVGTWQGSRVEKDLGGPISFLQYRLALNDRGRVRMVLQENLEMVGTYRVEGDRLKLKLNDEEGGSDDREYKFTLSSVMLTLFDPDDGSKVAELIRLREMDAIPGGGPTPGAPPDQGPAGGPEPNLDPSLATEDHAPKDGAFSCKYPKNWDSRGGSRPDNTYSWAEFTKGSARIRFDADVTGSLMADIAKNASGGDADDESPVASAHALGQRQAAESFSSYREGAARPLEHAALGTGRIAEFTADGSGLFASKVHGYRATVLTQNRRLTIVCSCPEPQWEKLKPTFFAVIQSVRR